MERTPVGALVVEAVEIREVERLVERVALDQRVLIMALVVEVVEC